MLRVRLFVLRVWTGMPGTWTRDGATTPAASAVAESAVATLTRLLTGIAVRESATVLSVGVVESVDVRSCERGETR